MRLVGTRGVPDRRSDTIELPVTVVRDAAENLVAFTSETDEALRAIEHDVLNGRIRLALNRIGRLQYQLQGARASWSEFANLKDIEATCADDVAAPGHGRAA